MLCKLCHMERNARDFYATNKSRCIECCKAAARKYRAENLEYVKEYDRNRPNRDERREGNKARYRKTVADPVGRQRTFETLKLWQMRNGEKRKAHILVGNAIRDGRLVRQPCERCGGDENIHAHHEDYSKPLDVTWLCNPCHAQRHREINAARRSQDNPLAGG